MTDDRSLERAARSWLDEGPSRAPDRTVEAALSRIQTTSQERDLRIPWRFPTMNSITRIAAAALVAALALGGVYFAFRPAADVGPPAPTIEGTWEAEFTRAEMLAAGIADADEDEPSNYGHFVLVIGGGRWNNVQLDGPVSIAGGTYTVAAETVTLTNTDNESFPIPFTVTGTTLTFGRGGPVTFRVKPWTRVLAPAPTPGPELTIDAYRTAWAGICEAAISAAPIPNMELWEFDRLYDPGMSASDRAKSLEVGREIARRSAAMSDQLGVLAPPAHMVIGHTMYVARGRATVALILDEVSALAGGDLTSARALDESTGPLSGAREGYTTTWGLADCP